MAVAKSSFVHNFCIPNAILTLKEYLLDFASEETKKVGERTIEQQMDQMADPKRKSFLRQALVRMEEGERDIRL